MQEEMNLPIGTVVRINKEKQLFMVSGYKVKQGNNIYDYCASLFPEGILSFNDVYVFNKDKIEEVLFEGYKNEQYDKLSDLLNNSK